MAPRPHHLTRAQALALLGLDTEAGWTQVCERLSLPTDPMPALPEILRAIEAAEPGGPSALLAQHLRKWLPNAESTTTVPLEPSIGATLKLKVVDRRQGAVPVAGERRAS